MSIAMFRSVFLAGLVALSPAMDGVRAVAADLGDAVDRVLTTASIGTAGKAAGKSGGAVAIGVYDPHDAVTNSDALTIEHVFVYWQALDKAMLKRKIAVAEAQGRALMISVEPYTHASDWRAGGRAAVCRYRPRAFRSRDPRYLQARRRGGRPGLHALGPRDGRS
ncbi:hypothetical protein [Ensifer canadensis]